jgi:glycosyltransferase involved in cell wall biosynthesis
VGQVLRSKVLFVIGQLERGGTELHLLQLASSRELSVFELVVICLRPNGTLTPAFEVAGARVRELRQHGSGVSGAISTMRQLTSMVAAEQPDIVHFLLPKAYLLGGLCLLPYHAKAKVMGRRSLNLYQRRYFGVAMLERLLHRSMDVCLANSHAVAAELIDEGVPHNKLGVVYNGVETTCAGNEAERRVLRSKLGLPADSFVVVTVANLIAYKGHQDVIVALAQIANAMPKPWVWCVLGRDDGIGAASLGHAEAAGLTDNIRWQGEVDNVADFLGCADLTVQASHQEGFSNAILQSMARGVAVVATDVGGNREAVADEVSGLLVEPGNPTLLAQAIHALAVDPERRARMGLAGRERVERLFSVQNCVRAYAQLYRNLIDGVQPPIPQRLQVDAQPH